MSTMDLGQISTASRIAQLNARVCSVKLKKPVLVEFPQRAPSVVIAPRQRVYTTADKTTCAECTCFPKDSPYRKPPILRVCQHSPLTLYELTAAVVDSIPLPNALEWSEEEVALWMGNVVGLPQYKSCILENHIDGKRLVQLEESSALNAINIHIYEHIKIIIHAIKKLYSLEFLHFTRSIGLPPRKPLTLCTGFKCRTGPSWGVRRNFTRCDILRWMKVLSPAPTHTDHWDLVWYEKPEFPKTLFARIPPSEEREKIPHLEPDRVESTGREYQVPRKFYLQRKDSKEEHLIWMEHKLHDPLPPGRVNKEQLLTYFRGDLDSKKKITTRKTLRPQKISLKGLTGDGLLLARRLNPTPKFFK